VSPYSLNNNGKKISHKKLLVLSQYIQTSMAQRTVTNKL